MKDDLKYIAYIVIAIAAVTIFLLSPSRCKRIETNVKHDTCYIVDTVIKPVTCYVSTTHVDTVLVSQLDTTLIHDTLFVYVPVKQHHYHYPDTADFYVSGYNAKLDSVFFHFKTSVIHETVEVPIQQRPLKFGLEAGINATLTDNKLIPGIYLDAGVSIRQRVKVKFGLGVNYDNGPKSFLHSQVTYVMK